MIAFTAGFIVACVLIAVAAALDPDRPWRPGQPCPYCQQPITSKSQENTMSVRAKFKCHSKEMKEQGGSDVAHLTFFASYGEGKDNKDWSKWTPSGTLTMSITNPAAFNWFEEGKEYYLDFSGA